MQGRKRKDEGKRRGPLSFFVYLLVVLVPQLVKCQQPSTYDIKGYVEPWLGYETPAVNILGRCFSGLGFTRNCRVCSFGSGNTSPTPRYRKLRHFIDESYDPDVQNSFAGCPPCEGEDNFHEDPHLCPTGPAFVNDMNRNAQCASRCADMCANDAAGCDAYTYIPQRCQVLPSGEEQAICPFKAPFCAMYDFDDLADRIEGQLNCQEFESYGGGFPYGQDVFWENTPLKTSEGESWCLNCCDNRRMSYHFKDTFAMECDYDTTQIGLAMGSLFSTPLSVEDDIQDLIFRFAKRETLDDEDSTTSCILNRHLVADDLDGQYKRSKNYLVGYNLTIGVTEHRSGIDYWKGVDYCYVEPIVSTRDYWETLQAADTVKFLEIITLTNMPDPLHYDRAASEPWHAWQRRLRQSNAATNFPTGFPTVLLVVVVVTIAMSVRVLRTLRRASWAVCE